MAVSSAKLIRWVDGQDDSTATPDSAGITDVAAYSCRELWAIAKVSNDIRYEWAAILEGRWEV